MYEVNASGEPVVTEVGRCVVKLVPSLPHAQTMNLYAHIRNNCPTHWLTFNVKTHDMSHVKMNGNEFIIQVLTNELDYYDNIIFVLVGASYRLISRSMSDKQSTSGVFVIDVNGLIHDDDLLSALKRFVDENLDFVSKYVGHSIR